MPVINAAQGHWTYVAHRAQGEFTLVSKRARRGSAVLALALQLALVVMWVLQTRVDAPPPRSGRASAPIQYLLMPSASPQGKLAIAKTQATKAAKPRKPVVTPPEDTITLPQTQPTPVEPPTPPEDPPAPRTLSMSEQQAAEFRRQWAQMQSDTQKKTIAEASHDGLRLEQERRNQERDLEMAKLRERDKSLQTVLEEHGQRPDPRQRRDNTEGSILDGELCVTGGGGERDLRIALPCLGANFITDFSWYARLHAPKRGEPSYRPLEPGGRVYVQKFAYSPDTLAAFAEATEQLQKIQVSIRMAYLPELRMPHQLLSRDSRAGAFGAEAFATEAEMAAYLRTWADNVRRWTAMRPAPLPNPSAGPSARP